jgi:beta-lactamase superfamily II metal-dependent hydrolase
MSYEVDVRAVGEESKSGDAIALRFGDLTSSRSQNVVVIDGGFASSAADVTNFLDEFYDTDDIDLMISTHPDGDHTAGLIPLVENLKVGELWMHRPWQYESEVYSYVLKGSSNRAFSESMKRALSTAWELEKVAKRKGVTIVEPFEGLTWGDGALHVLGPSQEYYSELARDFGTTAVEALAAKLKAVVTTMKERVVDLWDQEGLVEPDSDAVSNRNNSSVILHATLDESVLFTGDAGVPALDRALDVRDTLGIDNATFTQLPHHGSKRNVGPKVMTRLHGDLVNEGNVSAREAFVSAARKGSPKHPSQRVLNAAWRRGVKPFVTAGVSMLLSSTDRSRPGWSPMTPRPYQSDFEEE